MPQRLHANHPRALGVHPQHRGARGIIRHGEGFAVFQQAGRHIAIRATVSNRQQGQPMRILRQQAQPRAQTQRKALRKGLGQRLGLAWALRAQRDIVVRRHTDHIAVHPTHGGVAWAHRRLRRTRQRPARQHTSHEQIHTHSAAPCLNIILEPAVYGDSITTG